MQDYLENVEAEEDHSSGNIIGDSFGSLKKIFIFAAEIEIENKMCTITLSYNENDKVASEKLAALLATGLFIQQDTSTEDLNSIYGVKDAV